MPSKKSKMSKKSNKTNNKTNNKTKTKPMEVEYEARFLEIDRDEIINKIKALGGILKQSKTVYKRAVFKLCDSNTGFVRVRDEGDKVTLTAKIYKDPKFPQEYELQIKDGFENGQAFLQALNLTEKAYHETMREKWRIPFGKKYELCEVAIDYIPGLPMYAEVECKTLQDLNKSIKLLGLDKSKMRTGGYGDVFVEYYGVTKKQINDDISKLTFGNIQNELKPYIKKNEELLAKVAKQHLDTFNELKHKK